MIVIYLTCVHHHVINPLDYDVMVRLLTNVYMHYLLLIEDTNCPEGAVRLIGGDFDTEGRVEVCYKDIWGSVCGAGFDLTDAHVVCKELGLGTATGKRI